MADQRNLIDRVFTAQKSNSGFPSYEIRIDRLRRLGQQLRVHQEDFEKALQQDLGRHPTETKILESIPVAEELSLALRKLKKWMKPQKVATPMTLLGSKSRVELHPKGVALIIAPWNYPLSLSLIPLISAIAAGNRAILKPSELTPVSSGLLQKVIKEAFAEDEVAVFLGDQETASLLLKKPFDHIFFTGSTRVGHVVMAAAAEHLCSVTLELGGKSPVIIDRSADLRLAARKIAWGKFCNAGQTCVAPDFVFLPTHLKKEFVIYLDDEIKKRYGTEIEGNPDFARIVSANHFNRLHNLLTGAQKTGAKTPIGGPSSAASRYIPPTVLTSLNTNTPIMQEEIFGPILPVIDYDDLEEALRFIRARPNPLALYIFAKDRHRINMILKGTSSGGVCINETVIHVGSTQLPFGGSGPSGVGNYHGFYGYKTFSVERAVLKQGRLNTTRFFYPPYKGFTNLFIRRALNFLSRSYR